MRWSKVSERIVPPNHTVKDKEGSMCACVCVYVCACVREKRELEEVTSNQDYFSQILCGLEQLSWEDLTSSSSPH